MRRLGGSVFLTRRNGGMTWNTGEPGTSAKGLFFIKNTSRRLFWFSVVLGSPLFLFLSSAQAATLAHLWVDTNGGSCTRTSSPAVYNDATACASMQAAQTAASAGDTVILKNGS